MLLMCSSVPGTAAFSATNTLTAAPHAATNATAAPGSITTAGSAPGADPVTPDPTHCAAGQVATGRHRKILAKATPQAASYNPYAAAAEGPIASLASSSSSSEAALSDYANSLQTGSSSSSSEAAAAPSTSSKLSKQQVEALVKADAGRKIHRQRDPCQHAPHLIMQCNRQVTLLVCSAACGSVHMQCCKKVSLA